MDSRVSEVMRLMEAQMANRLKVPDLARAVGLSGAHLTRLFRAETGMPPGAFLQTLRMARARLLLERTSLPVADIMSRVGIADRSHFARDFKRTHGFGPRTLRLQLRVASGLARRWRCS